MLCPSCGSPVAADARFCASCGRPLRGSEDERRIVTVLFADIVGFTSLSERLDPERVKILVDRCFDLLAAEIHAFGGRVDKIVGDAVIALFGAPVAHEDDAERAVRAGLRLHDVLRAEAAELGYDLKLRVGINTGEVLVGAMRAAGSITAMGDVVNTAARLQSAASPGRVLVGPNTHEATADAIAYRALGALAVKGREDPVDTWEAIAPTAAPGERRRRRDVPLVGRDDELGLLERAVRTSFQHRRALFVLLAADVGVGKSRLADEVSDRAAIDHGAIGRVGRCLPYGEANVWWPVAEVMRPGAGIQPGDDEPTVRTKVRHHVARVLPAGTLDVEIDRVADGLSIVLGFEPTGNDLPDSTADSAAARDEAARSLVRYANALGALTPLVLQISDLHFADESLLRLVDDVMAGVHNRPIVVLATSRPNLLDRWQPAPGRHNSLVLHLDPLDRAASAELLHALVGPDVPDDLSEALLTRSGGNPFFLEELVSLVNVTTTDTGTVEVVSPDQPPPTVLTTGDAGRPLPATLRGLVSARLDDLDPSSRTVAQDASVIGRRGPVEGLVHLVAHNHPTDQLDTIAALHRLADEGILDLDDGTWRFRSDLVRDVAYQTLTKFDRARSHLGIGQYLASRADHATPQPSWLIDQVAHHHGAAAQLAGELGAIAQAGGLPDDLAQRAQSWAIRAARRAHRDGALPVAVRFYGEAIGRAPGAGSSDEEIADLHLAVAEAAAEAWDFEVALGNAAAAVALVPTVPSALHAKAAMVRGTVHQRQGAIDEAVAELMAAAEEYADLGLAGRAATARRLQALAEIFGGRLDDGARSATAALVGFEAVGDLDGQGWALQHLGWISFVHGDLATAELHVMGALERFSQSGNTRGIAWGVGLDAWIRFQRRDVAEAERLGLLVLDEARSRRDPWALAMMSTLVASIRLWSGQTDEAVRLGSEAAAAFRQIGNGYGTDLARAVQGRAQVMSGAVDEGFRVLVAEPADRAATGPSLLALTLVATAAQIGEPSRAAGVLAASGVGSLLAPDPADAAALAVPDPTTGAEPSVVALADGATLALPVSVGPSAVLGLLHLQRRDLAAADAELVPPDAAMLAAPDLAERLRDVDPSLTAVRGLLLAATGRDGADVLAAVIEDDASATYLDRAIAQLGAALRSAAVGDEAMAAAAVAAADQALAGTEDRIGPAVIDLVAGAVLDRRDRQDNAERALADLGISADGWRTIIATALAAQGPVRTR